MRALISSFLLLYPIGFDSLLSQSPRDCDFIFFLFCGIVYGVTSVASSDMQKNGRKCIMSDMMKRLMIIAVLAVVAFVLGRLSVRAVTNLLLGGTLFGGNFL